MKTSLKQLTTAALALVAGSLLAQTPPATPQGFITANAFTGIPGTTVASLTGSPKFPNQPDAVMFPPYFEFNATGDISTAPPDWGNDYGTQIIGYFYAPTTGDYTFYIAADDNAELYLSTNSSPANKRLIAQETVWSNAREFFSSGGASVLASKDSSQFTNTQWEVKDPGLGGAKITLQANQVYYIEALAKEGGGGDHLAVSVVAPGAPIDPSSPIPGEYLSSDRTAGPLTLTQQPQSQSIDERAPVTFRVLANGTPPYTYQWRRDSTDIPDATNLTYTVTNVVVGDNNARFSVFVSGGQGNSTSSEAVLTVLPDIIMPTLLGAKGNANLTEVLLTFSEALDPATANTASNYTITNTAGATLAVSSATLSPDARSVTLATAMQTLGTKYTLRVQNVRDTAATPNAVAAGTKAVFFPTGKLLEQNGLIVFEAENYDRNLDGRWVIDSTRGNPSGGASVVAPNGAGGNETGTQLEYDVEFGQAATYVVWYRASGNDGNDDSSWFWLDGARPVERSASNDDAMTGFSGQLDFVWRSDAFTGADPFTVDIPTAGPHVVGLARREDGSFHDKFILTTNTSYTPTGFGPPETREGVPAAPTVTLAAPTAGQVFAGGSDIVLSATAAGSSGLEITRVQFFANGNSVGEDTSSPFSVTWQDVPDGIYALTARATDEIGVSTTSAASVIEVGNPPPQALLVVGTASDPVLNPSDAGVKARLESKGWQVSVVQAPAAVTANGDGKQLVVVSSTVNSGDVGTKFRNSAVPVLLWEQAVQDDFLMTLNTDTVDRGTIAGQTNINIVKADHPLAAGLPTGVKLTTTAAQDYGWGAPNSNAVIIATIADNPAQAVIYGYEKGAILIDGTTPAPERRVLFFSGNDGFAAFTEDALKLFDAAVQWVSQVEFHKPTSAKIAWVSFHSADDTPSTTAGNAGFTNAPDIGYTDLLAAQGHQVTRIVTSGTPNATLLNAFDLVIISRSVPSGDYELAAETAAWNGITAPTMIMGGYLLRNIRLGFTTGGTMVDTTNTITLTVTDTNHPIFSGIALDATGKMVEPYANLAAFTTPPTTNLVQRGISVNTDPIAPGGTLLATVGTAVDPTFGGMIIGEWPQGAVTANARADVLAGHRLVFLTGSREALNFTTGDAAGIFDLTPAGTQLFLNAVNYLAGTEAAPPRPALSVTRTQTGISITFEGELESAGSLSGPWSNVPGATSPFPVTPSGPQQFYRAKK